MALNLKCTNFEAFWLHKTPEMRQLATMDIVHVTRMIETIELLQLEYKTKASEPKITPRSCQLQLLEKRVRDLGRKAREKKITSFWMKFSSRMSFVAIIVNKDFHLT